ncbi:MAG: hypothetical protein AB7G75_37115 [Candidatus Binatia bacterium]
MADVSTDARPANVVAAIVQHLQRYPCDLRHARKLFHLFQATPTEMEAALNQFAITQANDDAQRWSWLISQRKTPADHVLLHLLRYPADVIDIQQLMRRYQASETDIQQALAQIDEYVVEDGGIVVYEHTDKE